MSRLPRSRAWDAPDFLEREKENYRSKAQSDHGVVVNPITGQKLDIMTQCVHLRIDSCEQRDVGDHEAYAEVLSTFARRLELGLKVWVDADDRGTAGTPGKVSRVETAKPTSLQRQ